MSKSQKLSVFRMVCNNPESEGVRIERMPDLLDHDMESNYKAHTHTFYEILWFTEEGGSHTIDFQEYPIRKNTLFFLSPGQIHHFNEGVQPHGYSIKICADFYEKNTCETDGIRHGLFFAIGNRPFAYLEDEAVETLQLIVDRMEAEQHRQHVAYHQEMLNLMVRILMIVIQRGAQQPDVAKSEKVPRSHNLYIRFRNMLEEEFAQVHLVADYAERLGVSTKTLSKAVRASTGYTPLKIIDDRLILESKRLLRFSDFMVKEVAYNLGFDDPSNFVKFFRRHTGYLPGEFQTKK